MTSRLLPAFLFAAATTSAVLLACSSKDESTFTPTPPDASPEAIAPLLPDAGGSEGGEGGSGVCVADVPANFQSDFVPPKQNKGACQTADIEGYWTNCLANIREADHDAVCDAWVLANATCAGCIAPQDRSGAVLWLSYGGPKFYQINSGGCLAIVLADSSPQGCGALTHDASQCTWEACGKCQNPTDGTCRAEARAQGICSSKNNVRSSVCGTSDASRAECVFGDLKSAYDGTAAIFCGPP